MARSRGWFSTKTKREKVALLAGILIPVTLAAFGGAWTIYKDTTKSQKQTIEVTYKICIVSRMERGPNNSMREIDVAPCDKSTRKVEAKDCDFEEALAKYIATECLKFTKVSE